MSIDTIWEKAKEKVTGLFLRFLKNKKFEAEQFFRKEFADEQMTKK